MITLNGTTGITTPDITSEAGLTVDGVSFASGAPANTLVTTSGGNVGIGTSSPSHSLDITGNAMRIRAASNSDYAKIGFTNAAGSTPAWIGIDGDQTNSLSFHVASNIAASTDFERMRIASSGQVLVNTTSDVSASTIGTSAKFQSYTSATVMAASFVAASTGPWLMGFSSTSYNYKMYAGPSGPQLSNGSWVNSSDERLKTNITSIEGGLEKIMQLRAVGFNWIENNEYAYGFIAQEVQPVIPEIVTPPSPDGMFGLSYTELIPFLTKAIQEQQELITAQQTAIETLEARVAALEAA